MNHPHELQIDPSKGPSFPHKTAFELDDSTAARVRTLIKEGLFAGFALHSPVNLPLSLRRKSSMSSGVRPRCY